MLFPRSHERVIEMQHELFHSKFKPLVGRSLILDIIKDSPLGENPHRAVAMELIFDRTIDDCQQRMLAQAKKPSRADPVVQPDSCGKASARSSFTAVTQPTTKQPPPPTTQSNSTAPQPAQTRPPRTEPVLPRMRPPQPPKVQPPQDSSRKPLSQPPTSQPIYNFSAFGAVSSVPLVPSQPSAQPRFSVFNTQR